MTRNESGQFGRLRKRAAIIAALFFCATAVAAQDVALRSEGGGLEISRAAISGLMARIFRLNLNLAR